jgi:hypothetical protein
LVLKEIAMSSFDNDLRYLAARMGQGDRHARAELEQELEPQLQRIVRRAMRPTAGASALTQRIRAVAHRLSQDHPGRPVPDSDHLVDQVAQDLWESVVGRAPAGRRDGNLLRETVRT